jgi:hypothetical protein
MAIALAGRPSNRARLAIIMGRIETAIRPSKMSTIVRNRDGEAKQRLQALLRRSERAPDTKVRVLSNGEDGRRLNAKRAAHFRLVSHRATISGHWEKTSSIFVPLKTSDAGSALTGVI